MKEIKKFENKLLGRDELIFEFNIDKQSTISREEVKKQLIKNLKVDEKLLVINKISTKFKSDKSQVDVFIYKDSKILEDLTPKHIMKRNKGSEEVKEGEAE